MDEFSGSGMAEEVCANCGHARADHCVPGSGSCTEGDCGCSHFFEAEKIED